MRGILDFRLPIADLGFTNYNLKSGCYRKGKVRKQMVGKERIFNKGRVGLGLAIEASLSR